MKLFKIILICLFCINSLPVFPIYAQDSKQASSNTPIVKVSPKNLQVNVGGSRQLTGTVEPASTKLEWVSSDTSIATVDQKGKVTGVKPGSVAITVKVKGLDITSIEKEIDTLSTKINDARAEVENTEEALNEAKKSLPVLEREKEEEFNKYQQAQEEYDSFAASGESITMESEMWNTEMNLYLDELNYHNKRKKEIEEKINQGSYGFFVNRNASDATTIMDNFLAYQDSEGTTITEGMRTSLGASGDATSLENMEKALNLMLEANNLRTSEGLEAYHTSDVMMAISQIRANANAGYEGYFDYLESTGYQTQEQHISNVSTPFDTWYTQEKNIYNWLIEKGYPTSIDQLSEEQIAECALALNIPETAIETKHYLNILADYKVIGLGANGTEAYTFAQDFSNAMEGESIASYLEALLSYKETIATDLADCESSIASVEKQIANIQKEIDENNQEWQAYLEQLEKLENQLQEQKTDYENKVKQYEDTKASIPQLEQEVKEKKAKLAKLEKEFAAIQNKTGQYAISQITVSYPTIEVTSLKANPTTIKLNIQETKAVTITVLPDNATDKTITFTSSDPTIASVDETGSITGLKEGVATITAKASNGKKVTITVSVIDPNSPMPKLTAVYNSVKGIDFRFKPVEGATGYDIWRKNRGVWTKIDTVTPEQLEMDSGSYKYFDTEPKDLYGKIYLYSVAAHIGNTVTDYNEKGLGICRLQPPTIQAVTDLGGSDVKVEWKFADKSSGYQVQFSNTSDFKQMTKVDVEGRNTLNTVISGVSNGKKYFRIRSYMTDVNNITYYSQYSKVLSFEKKGSYNEDSDDTPSDITELEMPQLVVVYNSVKGIDFRFKPVSGAKSYDIWRKNRGVWAKIDSVPVSSLETENGNLKYFDTSVKDSYGKIYVYSVAARAGSIVSAYNEKGRGISRLAPPSLQSISVSGNQIYVNWTLGDKSDAYELQYSTTSDFKNVTKVRVEGRNTLNTTLYQLPKGKLYLRIRSSVTDSNNITYYSQYSKVKTINVR